VAWAHAQGCRVEVLPGASAVTLAVSASGLGGQSFAFVGYLPQEPEARRLRIRELEAESRRKGQTQVFIETPYRNAAMLEALIGAASPSTWLSVSLALTTPQAQTRTSRISTWREAPSIPAFSLSDRLPAVFCLASS
jgi:16S rRNA (cytidine1402-2'-O)-methyltransferase